MFTSFPAFSIFIFSLHSFVSLFILNISHFPSFSSLIYFSLLFLSAFSLPPFSCSSSSDFSFLSFLPTLIMYIFFFPLSSFYYFTSLSLSFTFQYSFSNLSFPLPISFLWIPPTPTVFILLLAFFLHLSNNFSSLHFFFHFSLFFFFYFFHPLSFSLLLFLYSLCHIFFFPSFLCPFFCSIMSKPSPFFFLVAPLLLLFLSTQNFCLSPCLYFEVFISIIEKRKWWTNGDFNRKNED